MISPFPIVSPPPRPYTTTRTTHTSLYITTHTSLFAEPRATAGAVTRFLRILGWGGATSRTDLEALGGPGTWAPGG